MIFVSIKSSDDFYLFVTKLFIRYIFFLPFSDPLGSIYLLLIFQINCSRISTFLSLFLSFGHIIHKYPACRKFEIFVSLEIVPNPRTAISINLEASRETTQFERQWFSELSWKCCKIRLLCQSWRYFNC